MTFVSYDDVTAALIPPDATHCSYYATGRYQNLNAIRKQCPNAKLMPVLTVPGQIPPLKEVVGWEHGVAIDVEPTDWTPAQAGAFAKQALSEGVMPVIYCSLSAAAEVVASLHAVGVQRNQFKLHTAHWTGQAHICSGIQTAMGVLTADATQYTDRALGRSLDASLCQDDYFSGLAPAPKPKPTPKPKPAPAQKHATGVANAALSVDWGKPAGQKLSVHGTTGTWKRGTDQGDELMQVLFKPDGSWHVQGIPASTPPLGHK